jgi:hypothetical protein
MLSRRILLTLLLVAAPAYGQTRAEYAAKAARRFPQPVRVGDLIGRDVLEPKERQSVLGRVVAVRRGEDGGVDMLVRSGGVLGIGGRVVAVPIEAMALLGEHVALMDITPDQLAKLPAAPDRGQDVPADEMIRVGLVRPFH